MFWLARVKYGRPLSSSVILWFTSRASVRAPTIFAASDFTLELCALLL
jgi:hypothetical protein